MKAVQSELLKTRVAYCMISKKFEDIRLDGRAIFFFDLILFL